jgi:hypothetical protein
MKLRRLLSHVLTAVTKKGATIFWDATPCSLMLIDVLEEYTASKFRLALLAWLTLQP